jgi:ankyrin repeat protein
MVVSFLLEKGANVNITDNKGKTPLDIAKDMNYEEMINVITDFMKPDIKFAGRNPVQSSTCSPCNSTYSHTSE